MAYISIITLDETFISLAAKLIHYSSPLGGYRLKYQLFKKDGLRNKWELRGILHVSSRKHSFASNKGINFVFKVCFMVFKATLDSIIFPADECWNSCQLKPWVYSPWMLGIPPCWSVSNKSSQECHIICTCLQLLVDYRFSSNTILQRRQQSVKIRHTVKSSRVNTFK